MDSTNTELDGENIQVVKKSAIKIMYLEKSLERETKHLAEMMLLTRVMSDKAIDTALNATNDWKETSNNKFGLLKDQNIEAAEKFATKDSMKAMADQLSALNRLVYMGLGIFALIALLSGLLVKFIK